MKSNCWIVLVVLACGGCYLSDGRSLELEADGVEHPDAAPDAVADAAVDVPIEVPDPACLYGPAGVRQLADSGHTSNAPHMFWNGSEVGVVMFEGGGEMIAHSYVSLVNVAPDLSTSTEPRIVGEESHGWGEPAWTGTSFGLCWHTDPGMVGRTAFRLLERGGDRIGGRIDLDFDGEACLGLVHGEGRFLASWRHEVWGEDDLFDVATWVQVLDMDGTPVGEPLELVVGPYAGTTPSLAWTGSSFLVVYPVDGRLEFLWLDADGETVREGDVAAPGAAFCDVAERDGVVAVAWITGERYERGLHFRVFGPDLAPLAEELLLEEDGTGAASPDVAEAPDGWAVSWHVGSGEEAFAMMLHVDESGLPRQPRILVYETELGLRRADHALGGQRRLHGHLLLPGWALVAGAGTPAPVLVRGRRDGRVRAAGRGGQLGHLRAPGPFRVEVDGGGLPGGRGVRLHGGGLRRPGALDVGLHLRPGALPVAASRAR
ncbi:MAG: hypothetical protein JRG91_14240 [Deltaproteobacteria bacterium]|nr:hypothetical protein [Deltaproteobacteria bacterium]